MIYYLTLFDVENLIRGKLIEARSANGESVILQTTQGDIRCGLGIPPRKKEEDNKPKEYKLILNDPRRGRPFMYQHCGRCNKTFDCYGIKNGDEFCPGCGLYFNKTGNAYDEEELE